MRDDVCSHARTWLKTPWQHQARLKGVGVDCANLMAGIAIDAGLITEQWWRGEVVAFEGYGRLPSNGMLLNACRRFMRSIPIDSVQPADVVLMRFANEPQHMAMIVPHPSGLGMLHAYSRAAPPSVVEHRYADVWRARVVEAFALPGIA